MLFLTTGVTCQTLHYTVESICRDWTRAHVLSRSALRRSKTLKTAETTFQLIFTWADSAVWIIEIRAIRGKSISMYWNENHTRHLGDIVNWSETPSRRYNRESEVLDVQTKKKKKKRLSGNVITAMMSWTKWLKEAGGAEREAGVPLMSLSAFRPQVDWGQA